VTLKTIKKNRYESICLQKCSYKSHTKTCQLFPAKIEILDLIEFFVDLKNPKIHPDPFSEGLL